MLCSVSHTSVWLRFRAAQGSERSFGPLTIVPTLHSIMINSSQKHIHLSYTRKNPAPRLAPHQAAPAAQCPPSAPWRCGYPTDPEMRANLLSITAFMLTGMPPSQTVNNPAMQVSWRSSAAGPGPRCARHRCARDGAGVHDRDVVQLREAVAGDVLHAALLPRDAGAAPVAHLG